MRPISEFTSCFRPKIGLASILLELPFKTFENAMTNIKIMAAPESHSQTNIKIMAAPEE